MNTRLVTLYCVCLLLGVNCDEQAVQDGISGRLNPKVHDDEIIRPESGRGANDEAFVGLPWLVPGRNFEQTPALTLKDLSKAELATLEKELLFAVAEKRGLAQQRSNRRSSAVSQSEEERNSRESGFPSEDRVASPVKSVIDSPSKGTEGGRKPRDLPGLFDPQKLLSLPDFLFKTGNSENTGLLGLPGLPGQPIRKFIEFLREKIGHKQEETNEDRPEDLLSLKRFFQRSKGLSGNIQENV